MSITRLAIPQASEEPLSTWEAGTVTKPFASKNTVTFWHNATGAILSITVTNELHVPTFPLLSITESVIVLEPTFAHVKILLDNCVLIIEQLSVEPLSTWEGVIEAKPELFKFTVNGWQIAVGAWLSIIKTKVSQLDSFPWISVTSSGITICYRLYSTIISCWNCT